MIDSVLEMARTLGLAIWPRPILPGLPQLPWLLATRIDITTFCFVASIASWQARRSSWSSALHFAIWGMWELRREERMNGIKWWGIYVFWTSATVAETRHALACSTVSQLYVNQLWRHISLFWQNQIRFTIYSFFYLFFLSAHKFFPTVIVWYTMTPCTKTNHIRVKDNKAFIGVKRYSYHLIRTLIICYQN